MNAGHNTGHRIDPDRRDGFSRQGHNRQPMPEFLTFANVSCAWTAMSSFSSLFSTLSSLSPCSHPLFLNNDRILVCAIQISATGTFARRSRQRLIPSHAFKLFESWRSTRRHIAMATACDPTRSRIEASSDWVDRSRGQTRIRSRKRPIRSLRASHCEVSTPASSLPCSMESSFQ